MAGNLEKLLERMRDGIASAEEVEQARALVRGDARLPDDLRAVALIDDAELESDAVGLLAVLGAAPLFDEGLRETLADGAGEMMSDAVDDGWRALADGLRERLAAEAEGFEVSDAVMARLPPAWPYGPVTAQAVTSEAGSVDVAPEAMAALGVESSLVAEAVASESGAVDVSGAVLVQKGRSSTPVAEAVEAESGTVDLGAPVMDAVAPAPSGSLGAPPTVPAPANRGWTLGAVLMAAVALVVFGVSQLPGGRIEAPPSGSEIIFAAAGDVVVEDLDYADDVVVMQAEGDEGAVILWMEDA